MGFVSCLEDILDRSDDDMLDVRRVTRIGKEPTLPVVMSVDELDQGLAYLGKRRETAESKRLELKTEMDNILRWNAKFPKSPLINMLFANRDSRHPLSPIQTRKQELREGLRKLGDEIREIDRLIDWVRRERSTLPTDHD